MVQWARLLGNKSKLGVISVCFAMGSTYAALPHGTLVFCSEGSPAGFDPGQSLNTVDFSASALTVYNRLVEFERGGTATIQPSLAESWDISPDGRVYTFHLRRGVKFHTTPWFKPTRDFNAEDVAFTFERMRNPNMAFRKAYPTESSMGARFEKIIAKIEVSETNPYSVRFTLNKPHSPFLSNLAIPAMSILSAEYAAQLLKQGHPSDISWKPIGTGPFIFQEYIKDATIRFKGNTEYWNPGDVQLSKLVFEITPNTVTRTQKLKANECQVVSDPHLTEIPDLERNPDIRVLSQPGLNMAYLGYNTAHPPLDDVRIRRVLDRAIDKKAIIDQVYQGRAQIAVAPMSPLQWSYDKNLKDRPRNLKRAKTLLIQAGYPDGFSITLWTLPITRPYNPNPQLMAEMIQSDWAQIGITAKIITYEKGEFINRVHDGEHDTLLIGDISTGDPDGFLGQELGCDAARNSFVKWCHKPFNDLIQQAVRTTDIARRIQLYRQAQKIFKREQPLTPIAYPIVYQPIHKTVTGFKIDPFGTIFYGVGLK